MEKHITAVVLLHPSKSERSYLKEHPVDLTA